MVAAWGAPPLATPVADIAPPAPLAPEPAAEVTSAGTRATVAAPAPVDALAALDFLGVARTLSRVAACTPDGDIPARLNAPTVDAHCKMLATLTAQWSTRWLSQARPFFEQVVPKADLPDRVVYPFGGGDLLTALVVFPHASEITTLSLEPAGDPRLLETLEPPELAAALLEVRKKVNHIFSMGHSKTTDMRKVATSKLPGDLVYSLAALSLNNFEMTSVKFFRVGATGELLYVTKADLDAVGLPDVTGRRSPYANVEISFRARGGGPPRIFRHIAVNLDDAHMEADPSVLRHLQAKGRVAAITKAASYLLWWKEFSNIRDYLLQNMVWMVSDSTGIPTDQARAAGFEQLPFGRFDGPFLGGGNRPTEVFKKLWADGAEPLKFRFGYPDSAGHDHLLITRRATEK